ncbi:bacterial bifunctional deaminase-reductase [Daedaleopsis nitida]|nr:bacterial bifunctional deaminase-reductase [Daedaleopsis nitida]
MPSPHQGLPEPPTILQELYALSSTPETHLSVFYPDRDPSTHPSPASSATHKPFVTLTFAQSLDAKIAGAGGKQLILSGKESMVMTHWMRTLHDAILVGVGTALNDDPQLNTRHLPPLPTDYPHPYRLPRPIILDTHLRTSPECKLLKNFQAGRGRRPWIICARHHTPTVDENIRRQKQNRATALETAGSRVIEVDADNATGMISIPSLLAALRADGVRSLMVEGGAQVIGSFLSAAKGASETPSRDNSGFSPKTAAGGKIVDALVVTVAPTLVGDAGVGYGPCLLANVLPKLEHVRTEVFGPDAVSALRVV